MPRRKPYATPPSESMLNLMPPRRANPFSLFESRTCRSLPIHATGMRRSCASTLTAARAVLDLIDRALAEDGADRDLTTAAVVPDGSRAKGRIEQRAAGVPAGLRVAEAVFRRIDSDVEWRGPRGGGGGGGAGGLAAGGGGAPPPPRGGRGGAHLPRR